MYEYCKAKLFIRRVNTVTTTYTNTKFLLLDHDYINPLYNIPKVNHDLQRIVTYVLRYYQASIECLTNTCSRILFSDHYLIKIFKFTPTIRQIHHQSYFNVMIPVQITLNLPVAHTLLLQLLTEGH